MLYTVTLENTLGGILLYHISGRNPLLGAHPVGMENFCLREARPTEILGDGDRQLVQLSV